MHRPEPVQPGVFDHHAHLPPAFHHRLHSSGVPGDHDVFQGGVRARDGDEFVTPTAPLGREPSVVDRTLQLMNRLASVEEGVQLPSEVRVGEVVAQEQRPEQSPEFLGGAASWISAGSAAPQTQSHIGTYPTDAYRGGETQHAVPSRSDGLQRHARTDQVSMDFAKSRPLCLPKLPTTDRSVAPHAEG
jgi:hypothetical protein